MNGAKASWSPFVGLALVIALLFGLLFQGWRLADEQERARTRWVAVAGRVVATSIEVDEEYDEYHSIYYYPRITYAYRFAEQELLGRRFHVTDNRSYGTRESAQAVLDRWAGGTTIQVWVDPDEPSRAALQIDGSSLPYLRCLIATALLAVPVLAMLLRLRPRLRTLGLVVLAVGWYAVLAWAVPHWRRNCAPEGFPRIFVWAVFGGYAALGGVVLLMILGSVRRR